jgi:hypothetical protein
MTVSSKDISVVVQGPIFGKLSDPPEVRLTQRCLESMRRHLPEAEVILSTWKGAATEGLNYDIHVENEDPGPISGVPLGSVNVNRQIVSTRNGLQKTSRPYVLKFRSDMLFESANFLDAFDRFEARNPNLQLFRSRIVIPRYYSRNPRLNRFFFHPSDLAAFGQREDLLLLWEIPLVNADSSSASPNIEKTKIDADLMKISGTFLPEQYIWLSALRKKFDMDYPQDSQITPKLLADSEISLVNNFIIVDFPQFGCSLPKYFNDNRAQFSTYSHWDWLRLYRKYCDKSYRIPLNIRGSLKRLILEFEYQCRLNFNIKIGVVRSLDLILLNYRRILKAIASKK